MTGQRKRYSAELKAKVALEAIKGHKMANEIASAYGCGMLMVTNSSTIAENSADTTRTITDCML